MQYQEALHTYSLDQNNIFPWVRYCHRLLCQQTHIGHLLWVPSLEDPSVPEVPSLEGETDTHTYTHIPREGAARVCGGSSLFWLQEGLLGLQFLAQSPGGCAGSRGGGCFAAMSPGLGSPEDQPGTGQLRRHGGGNRLSVTGQPSAWLGPPVSLPRGLEASNLPIGHLSVP